MVENERRGSCRYEIPEVEASLSWFALGAADGPTLTPDEESALARVMARWTSNRGVSGRALTLGSAANAAPSAAQERPRTIIRARILDISQTGLQIRSTAPPPTGTRLWIRLESSRPTEWVEVVLKGVSPEPRGTFHYRVRLMFREACPYDFFKILIHQKPIP